MQRLQKSTNINTCSFEYRPFIIMPETKLFSIQFSIYSSRWIIMGNPFLAVTFNGQYGEINPSSFIKKSVLLIVMDK